uniref:Uncharacterized protein n=1 Tax=Haptolina brevifila TaxID=156173 RepID=A0A7S2DE40_9EUKA|mmetsp:Transcript_37109/g.74147  ORF Transcript_37109/g.74147 Transcript_37109/m.74147 type:complete len:152 (+) Transcript_37109:35-490(+)
MSTDLASLLAPGSTQPGAFYGNPNLNTTLRCEPQRGGPAGPAAPSSEWKLTNEMMNQPWGSVLRQLDPGAANAAKSYQRPSAPPMIPPLSPRLATPHRSTPMVPSMGSGKAYTHSMTGARLAHPPGVNSQFSGLGGAQLRPDLLYARPFAS